MHAKLRLIQALDYVVLEMFSGQTLAVPKLLFLEEHDFVSFIRECATVLHEGETPTRVLLRDCHYTRLDGFLKRHLASVNYYFCQCHDGFRMVIM